MLISHGTIGYLHGRAKALLWYSLGVLLLPLITSESGIVCTSVLRFRFARLRGALASLGEWRVLWPHGGQELTGRRLGPDRIKSPKLSPSGPCGLSVLLGPCPQGLAVKVSICTCVGARRKGGRLKMRKRKRGRTELL